MAKQVKKQNQNKIVPIVVIITAIIVIVCIVAAIANNTKKDSNKPGQNTVQDKPEDKTPNPSESSTAEETISKCYADIVITVELDGKSAPLTVQNFVSLAKDGFYNGLTFHRIIEGFMMQGGDPEGTGMGGSDQTIPGEFTANGYNNQLSHTRGAISMARSSNYDSASSQFFIVHQDNPGLDGQYAVFGYVTEGIEVVDAVCTDAQPVDGNGYIAPDAQPVITSITIRDEE